MSHNSVHRRLPPELVAADGRLRSEWLPAAYLDTSIMLDYHIADFADYDQPPDQRDFGLSRDARKVRGVIRTDADRNLEAMVALRKHLERQSSQIHCVTSPLAELESAEFWAREAMSDLLLEAFGPTFLFRKEKTKILGGYIAEIFRAYPWTRYNIDELNFQKFKEEVMELPEQADQALAGLDEEAREHRREELNRRREELRTRLTTFIPREGFRGEYIFHDKLPEKFVGLSCGDELVPVAPITSFCFKSHIPDACGIMAALQIGAADILHVLFASHLGCTYFVSRDEDFRRAETIMREEFNLTLLSSGRELLELLNREPTRNTNSA